MHDSVYLQTEALSKETHGERYRYFGAPCLHAGYGVYSLVPRPSFRFYIGRRCSPFRYMKAKTRPKNEAMEYNYVCKCNHDTLRKKIEIATFAYSVAQHIIISILCIP